MKNGIFRRFAIKSTRSGWVWRGGNETKGKFIYVYFYLVFIISYFISISFCIWLFRSLECALFMITLKYITIYNKTIKNNVRRLHHCRATIRKMSAMRNNGAKKNKMKKKQKHHKYRNIKTTFANCMGWILNKRIFMGSLGFMMFVHFPNEKWFSAC